ncbi:MAG: SGNH/GDSL hydrolase family protein [Phycisphaerales bacterium]
MHRRLIFFAVLLALPVVVLAAIEGALRLAGLGGYPPTFVEPGRLDDGSRLVFTDARGPGSYFFASRSQGLALDPVPLVDPKPAGTVRIVWVGGSAAKGIPQERPLRASAFLEEMLADLWPGRDVEVINIGVPGIASYPVLGVMTEALDYDPDLVVAYLGNNEFYGAYGVASLHAAGRSPAMIRLTRAVRSTAIAQGFDRLLRGKNTVPARDLMEAMVADASIAPDSPMRDAAAATLEAFVGDMIDRCHARDVPIIVCPPPCNESGMAPLGVADLSALDAPSRSAVESALARAHDRRPAAESEAARCARTGPRPRHRPPPARAGPAGLQDRNEEAASEFRLAVDLDPMPWRPPTSSIEAIRRAALAPCSRRPRRGVPGTGLVGSPR